MSSVCVLSSLGTEQHLTCVRRAGESPRKRAEVRGGGHSFFGSISSEVAGEQLQLRCVWPLCRKVRVKTKTEALPETSAVGLGPGLLGIFPALAASFWSAGLSFLARKEACAPHSTDIH